MCFMRLERTVTKVRFMFGDDAERAAFFRGLNINTISLKLLADFSGRVGVGNVEALFIFLETDRDEGNDGAKLLFFRLEEESHVIALINLIGQHARNLPIIA